MIRWYIDTSAAAKLIVREAESAALITELNKVKPNLVSSLLLETELRRMVHRIDSITQENVTTLLSKISLFMVEPAQFIHAGLLPGKHLRSPDALHLATAIDLQVDALVTYDVRMRSAATDSGLSVISP